MRLRRSRSAAGAEERVQYAGPEMVQYQKERGNFDAEARLGWK